MVRVIENVLNRLNGQGVATGATETPGLEPAYSIQQLVRHYGNSESFWRKELARGRLRFFKLGSLTRISQSALTEYLQRERK